MLKFCLQHQLEDQNKLSKLTKQTNLIANHSQSEEEHDQGENEEDEGQDEHLVSEPGFYPGLKNGHGHFQLPLQYQLIPN